MSNFDADGGAENPWDDCGGLAWNEFDWERYLRGQDESIRRYLRFYEAARDQPERIDWVAEKMGWGAAGWTDEEDGAGDAAEAEGAGTGDDEVYTLHQNPIYIATKAIYAGLCHSWQRIAGDADRVPPPVAVGLLLSLHRGESLAVEAIHALDFGDFAMAVSLFKRALAALNGSLAILATAAGPHGAVAAWREEARPRIFDLREVWLRVMAECRDELARPAEEEEED